MIPPRCETLSTPSKSRSRQFFGATLAHCESWRELAGVAARGEFADATDSLRSIPAHAVCENSQISPLDPVDLVYYYTNTHGRFARHFRDQSNLRRADLPADRRSGPRHGRRRTAARGRPAAQRPAGGPRRGGQSDDRQQGLFAAGNRGRRPPRPRARAWKFSPPRKTARSTSASSSFARRSSRHSTAPGSSGLNHKQIREVISSLLQDQQT